MNKRLSIFPHYIQMDSMDCGPTCLRIIATDLKSLIRAGVVYN